jgi:hypothetical protein
MDFPDKSFFSSTLKIGAIFYFKDSELLKTNEPHFFIVLHISEDRIITLCCTTTNLEGRYNFIMKRNLPETTLTCILPAPNNGFKKNSYVDCNSLFQYTQSKLESIYNVSGMRARGHVTEENLREIITGIIDSPLIEEEIKDLFRSR